MERTSRDYGLDLVLFTFTEAGRMEHGNVFLQVKATERLTWLRRSKQAAFRVERAALVGWLAQLIPVILVEYDATKDRAYWLHIQGYFAALPGFSLFTSGETVTVHLSAGQALVPASIRTFAALRDAVLGLGPREGE